MPEYLAPGVFVEETSFRAKSIEGVGTSVAGIVGTTRTGPLRGTPEPMTSVTEFERTYGDAADLDFGDGPVTNQTAIAARAFFDNGGKQLFVSRVLAGVNQAAADGSGASAALAARSGTGAGGATVTFRARFPGRAGNYLLELVWRDSENLARFESVTPKIGDTTLISGIAPASVLSALPNGVVATDALNLQLVAVRTDAATYTPDAARVAVTRVDTGAPVALAANTTIAAAHLPAGVRFIRGYAKQPTSGALTDGTPAELRLAGAGAPQGLTAVLGDLGGLTRLVGTIDAQGSVLTVPKALNPLLPADLTLPIAALAAARAQVGSLVVQRSFDLDVRRRLGTGTTVDVDDRDGEVVWTYANLTLDPGADDALAARLLEHPGSHAAALTSPLAALVRRADLAAPTTAQVLEALRALFDAPALTTAIDPVAGPRYLIALSGGTDGAPAVPVDYAGESDSAKGDTGLTAFESIEDIAIVLTPAAAMLDLVGHQGVVLEVQKHVNKMRYRVGIVDSRHGQTIGDVRAWRSNFSDSRLALYYPWVRIADPSGVREEITVPPSGFIAGLYARTDVQRGVHKAPANDVVFGALGFEVEVNRFQQELLNPDGINCLRSFPGRGRLVWGARTLSGDPEWKYLNVRRYFLFLERSIDKSTQWAVFEPNGEGLWANVAAAVDGFLFSEWRNGHLLGADPKSAYFVRCDRTTMTQNDIDNGRLVCLVGVAPLTPAEFVVFRIGQFTADA
ncbi:MAG: phage tail sheath subtilisin-like domain-containing protein [Planctomycetes bacterium]|nr:phage tail sheath subtilisin-like domain-containing protein [Planctomycetota bacterium]